MSERLFCAVCGTQLNVRASVMVEPCENCKRKLAPELEKARLWDRVKEVAKRNNLDGYPCEGCSVMKSCDSGISLCGQAEFIVDALEKEDGDE